MKYQVGDRVLVRGDLREETVYWMENHADALCAVGEMLNFASQIVTIKSVFGNRYRIEEDKGCWLWTDEMFDGFANYTEVDVSDLI